MRRAFLIIIVGVFFVLPSISSAQIPTQLVQCDGAAGFAADGKTPLKECQLCDAVTLAQTIINFLVGIAAFLAVIIFCRAGFLMLTSAGDMGKVTKAREMFTNVAFGMVIVLAGWLIIDTVMKYAFQGNTGEEGSPLYKAMVDQFGPWNEIKCVATVTQTGSTPGVAPVGGVTAVSTGGASIGTGATLQCPPGNTACGVPALKAVGYNDAGANAMACIAITESRGNTNTPDNPKSGACGTFQFVPGNWANPALHAGNCTTAKGDCNNEACNLQTAAIMSRNRVAKGQSPYADWTCINPICNPNAQACVDKYDPAYAGRTI